MKISLPLCTLLLASSAIAQAATTEETQHVVATEQARIKAFADDDKPAFDRLVADELTMVHSNGELLGKQDEMAAMRRSTPANPLPSLAIEDPSVRLYGATAVMTGSLVERKEGRVLLRLAFTNTYAKQAGQWRLVAGQLTRAEP